MWNHPNHFNQAVAAEPPGPRGAAPLPEAIQRLPPIDAQLTPEERVNVAVYEAVNRSVVNIVTKIPGTANFLMLDNSQEGAGSGSMLDKRGNILRNFPVIEGAKKIQATLFDGSSYEAKLVGRDVSSDVAVIKIEAPQELLYPVT